MYVITAHQRHRQTDGQTDVKRSHDRYIAKACSGKNCCCFQFLFSKTLFLQLRQVKSSPLTVIFWELWNKNFYTMNAFHDT